MCLAFYVLELQCTLIFTMPGYSKQVRTKRGMANKLLCRARLHKQHPLRVIPGNKHLFYHGSSYCISWISSAVGISQACVSHSLLYFPQGSKQTIQTLWSTMSHHQWFVNSKLLLKCIDMIVLGLWLRHYECKTHWVMRSISFWCFDNPNKPNIGNYNLSLCGGGMKRWQPWQLNVRLRAVSHQTRCCNHSRFMQGCGNVGQFANAN